MATASVVLDTTQYVRVNIDLNPIMLQAHRDAVRIVFVDDQPARSNNIFHLLGDGKDPLQMSTIDTNVWALAMSNESSLMVTEFPTAAIPVVNDDLLNSSLDQNKIGYNSTDLLGFVLLELRKLVTYYEEGMGFKINDSDVDEVD